jgi:hypothetical protein
MGYVKTDLYKEETNNNNRKVVSVEEDMPTKKRIYNPYTGKYYELQQRSSVNRDAGQIRGLWSSKKKSKK